MDRFGKLTVEEYYMKLTKIGYRQKFAKCRCDCGGFKDAYFYGLKSGNIKSCGCLKGKQNITHGQSKNKLFRVWQGIKNRCYNPNHQAYKDYGKRGISMCSEWRTSFACFLNWCLDHGHQQGLSIERIDVNGNYEPGNCTLIPRADQSKNTRCTVRVEFRGEVKHLAEWARVIGVSPATIKNRINRGVPLDQVSKFGRKLRSHDNVMVVT